MSDADCTPGREPRSVAASCYESDNLTEGALHSFLHVLFAEFAEVSCDLFMQFIMLLLLELP